jgi:hypothetical protein
MLRVLCDWLSSSLLALFCSIAADDGHRNELKGHHPEAGWWP